MGCGMKHLKNSNRHRILVKRRDRFLAIMEGTGWVLLIGFCLFIADKCGYLG